MTHVKHFKIPVIFKMGRCFTLAGSSLEYNGDIIFWTYTTEQIWFSFAFQETKGFCKIMADQPLFCALILSSNIAKLGSCDTHFKFVFLGAVAFLLALKMPIKFRMCILPHHFPPWRIPAIATFICDMSATYLIVRSNWECFVPFTLCCKQTKNLWP